MGFEESHVEIDAGFSEFCAVTGEKIKRMEPHVIIFGDLIINKNGFDRIRKSVRNSDVELSNNEISVSEVNQKECSFCVSSADFKIIDRKKGRTDCSYRFCGECYKEFESICLSGFRTIKENIIYHNSSGFKVVKYPREAKFDTPLSSDTVSSDMVIDIGCDNKSQIRLCDLLDFIDSLKNPTESDFITSNIQGRICDICSRDRDVFSIGYKTKVCKECKESLVESMEDYAEDNKKLIVSRTL